MNNPLSVVKQTRTRYDRELEKAVMEVQVAIEGVTKAWMPLDLLIALVNLNQND